MSIFTTTMDQADDLNSTNTTKENQFSSTINMFKNKLMGVLSPKKEVKQKSRTGRFELTEANINKSDIKIEEKSTSTNKLNITEEQSIFKSIAKNNEYVSKLEGQLKTKKNLLSHFEKIDKYVSEGTEKEVTIFKKEVKEIEDKLITLKIQKIKLENKLIAMDIAKIKKQPKKYKDSYGVGVKSTFPNNKKSKSKSEPINKQSYNRVTNEDVQNHLDKVEKLRKKSQQIIDELPKKTTYKKTEVIQEEKNKVKITNANLKEQKILSNKEKENIDLLISEIQKLKIEITEVKNSGEQQYMIEEHINHVNSLIKEKENKIVNINKSMVIQDENNLSKAENNKINELIKKIQGLRSEIVEVQNSDEKQDIIDEHVNHVNKLIKNIEKEIEKIKSI